MDVREMTESLFWTYFKIVLICLVAAAVYIVLLDALQGRESPGGVWGYVKSNLITVPILLVIPFAVFLVFSTVGGLVLYWLSRVFSFRKPIRFLATISLGVVFGAFVPQLFVEYEIVDPIYPVTNALFAGGLALVYWFVIVSKWK